MPGSRARASRRHPTNPFASTLRVGLCAQDLEINSAIKGRRHAATCIRLHDDHDPRIAGCNIKHFGVSAPCRDVVAQPKTRLLLDRSRSRGQVLNYQTCNWRRFRPSCTFSDLLLRSPKATKVSAGRAIFKQARLTWPSLNFQLCAPADRANYPSYSRIDARDCYGKPVQTARPSGTLPRRVKESSNVVHSKADVVNLLERLLWSTAAALPY